MIEIYLINGTGDDLDAEHEENLSTCLTELQKAREEGNIVFDHSLDEDLMADKLKAKQLYGVIEEKADQSVNRLCFIHKNDTKMLLGIESLPQFENDRFVYFTTQNKSDSSDCEGWLSIDLLLSRLVEYINQNRGQICFADLQKTLFNNMDDKINASLNDLIGHIAGHQLRRFESFDPDDTRLLWDKLKRILEEKGEYPENEDLAAIESGLSALSKEGYKEITLGLMESLSKLKRSFK
jgi:hypothetical protein